MLDPVFKKFPDQHDEEEEEEMRGICTPPLWKSTSPPKSPRNRYNHYRSLSPSSRAEAIARGQKELMELVSKMPEGCYELTLKDIVEQQKKQQTCSSSLVDQFNQESRSFGTKDSWKKGTTTKKVQYLSRSGSLDNGGFLLKMVSPISWGTSRKKQMCRNNSNSAKDGRRTSGGCWSFIFSMDTKTVKE